MHSTNKKKVTQLGPKLFDSKSEIQDSLKKKYSLFHHRHKTKKMEEDATHILN